MAFGAGSEKYMELDNVYKFKGIVPSMLEFEGVACVCACVYIGEGINCGSTSVNMKEHLFMLQPSKLRVLSHSSVSFFSKIFHFVNYCIVLVRDR